MRRTTTTVPAALLAVLMLGGVVGCSKSPDEQAADCAAALTDRTGSKTADTPTVGEAKKRVDALDDTLAGMVSKGYASVASDAYDAVEKQAQVKKGRPGACGPLSKDDYNVLLMAKAVDGLGWTDGDGGFDKLKMVEGLD